MQIQATVITENGKKIIKCDSSLTVLDIIKLSGQTFSAPCGGNGRCGKCKVKITGSVTGPSAQEKSMLTSDEIASGIRLACMTKPLNDITISILCNKSYDMSKESYEKQPVFHQNLRNVGIAADIGTTTVAVYFYDLDTGTRLDIKSGANAQASYGADVISRIGYCISNENGLKLLQKVLVDQLNEYIVSFCAENNVEKETVVSAVIAGNTAMEHILAGISPAGLAQSPFTPATLFGTEIQAKSLGLNINEDAQVYFTPCISAFVGGDITAGLLACGFDQAEQTTLFVDIGTNGEMALHHRGKIYCCSVAAGPAFEGAHIKYGAAGIPGAIRSVELVNGQISVQTIQNKKPTGICGSGLIDAVSVMLKTGVLDETGRIHDGNSVTEKDGQRNFLIDPPSGISVTQKDIREVQLAKSAVAAGIEVLHKTALITYNQVQTVYISGSFGAHLCPENACKIGLLPNKLLPLIKPIGSTAGAGVSLILRSRATKRLENILKKCVPVPLSANPYFEEKFIENMHFKA